MPPSMAFPRAFPHTQGVPPVRPVSAEMGLLGCRRTAVLYCARSRSIDKGCYGEMCRYKRSGGVGFYGRDSQTGQTPRPGRCAVGCAVFGPGLAYRASRLSINALRMPIRSFAEAPFSFQATTHYLERIYTIRILAAGSALTDRWLRDTIRWLIRQQCGVPFRTACASAETGHACVLRRDFGPKRFIYKCSYHGTRGVCSCRLPVPKQAIP